MDRGHRDRTGDSLPELDTVVCQQLVLGEPFRGKFRREFEKPVPLEPGKHDRIECSMPDVCHVFRKEHRMMVQVQGSWFPLTDLNLQKSVDIPHAVTGDFQRAVQRIYRGGAGGSRLIVRVADRWN